MCVLCLFTQDFFGGIHDADGWVGRALGAKLLGIRPKHVGIDVVSSSSPLYQPSNQVSTSPISSLLLSGGQGKDISVPRGSGIGAVDLDRGQFRCRVFQLLRLWQFFRVKL